MIPATLTLTDTALILCWDAWGRIVQLRYPPDVPVLTLWVDTRRFGLRAEWSPRPL